MDLDHIPGSSGPHHPLVSGIVAWSWQLFPSWQPHYEKVEEGDLHEVDRGHWVDHDFRETFETIATEN